MAYKKGTANGYKDLLLALKGFLENAKMAHNIAAGSNTGTGYISAERASTSPVDETWTLTATSSTNFTVVGSVSGSQADATVGTPYDNGIVAFTIIAGGTAFVAGDSFTFDVADGLGATEKWAVNRYDTNVDGTGEHVLLLEGPGTSGDDEIFVGIKTESGTIAEGNYYNWQLQGFTGYSSGSTFENQPGIITNPPRMLLWNSAIPYWFFANGRRFVVVAKPSTVYESCYMGFLLPYATPTQYPYPLAVGGSWGGVAAARYNNLTIGHSSFIDNRLYSSTYYSLFILYGSAWYGFDNSTVSSPNFTFPFRPEDGASPIKKNFIGTIDIGAAIFPIIPMSTNSNLGAAGELQGCFAVTQTTPSAEDEITIDADVYIVFQNTFNTEAYSYWAMKKE